MKPSLLILWNQAEEDIYEHWRRQGPRPLAWDPERSVPDVGTVAEDMNRIVAAAAQVASSVRVVNIEDDLDRLMAALRLYRPDVVMNLVEFLHDDAGLEAYVAGLYDLFGVAYTGSDPFTLSLCQNKYRTKLILDGAGLPTSPYFLADKEPVPSDHELTFPLIVKPALEDASGGIEAASVVHDQAGLEARVRQVRKEFQMPALVEEYVEGREIHAAILGNRPPVVLPLFEMEFDDSEFNPDEEWRPQIISYRAKWDPHSPDFYSMDSRCPAEDLDPEIEAYIREVAVEAYKTVGCRDYARVDMRVDEEEGEVYILEVNPNPDIAAGAAFMECAVASERSFDQTIGEIIGLAWQRALAARAAASADPLRGTLPSDHLMREWVVQARTGERAPLPLVGGLTGLENPSPTAPTPAPAGPTPHERGPELAALAQAPAAGHNTHEPTPAALDQAHPAAGHNTHDEPDPHEPEREGADEDSP